MNIETSDFTQGLAIRTTRFFLRITGFWFSKNRGEKLILDVALAYTIVTMSLAMAITGSDLWFSRRNFDDASFAACNALSIFEFVTKLAIFTLRRSALVDLIDYCHKTFWVGNYDAQEQMIILACERQCIYFVKSFIFFAQATVFAYVLDPLIENVGKNETARILPVKIWLNLPTTSTPYYEVLFIIEILTLYQVSFCYFSFDSFLCLMNVHVAGQFRILKRRLELVCSRDGRGLSSDEEVGSKMEKLKDSRNDYWTFDECVRHHQTLIDFNERVENLYTYAILGQVVIFSFVLCFVGYQAVLSGTRLSRRIIFVVHSGGTLTQLFVFTLTCGDMTWASELVAEGAYGARWYNAPTKSLGRMLTKDLMFVIARCRRPCCLTAGGFTVITSETFRAILSSAASYLTLLRQSQQSESK